MSAKKAEPQETLYVGIDLGTSQSSISASTGERHVVRSLVGWPVDMVAKKVVKKSVLIGQEALDNRSMLDLHRPLERGLIKEGSEKDLSAVRELLSHLLSLVGVDTSKGEGKRVRAVVGVPAEAMRVNKQQLRNTLSGLVDGLMVVSEPFAVAYGLDALLHTMVVDLGAGTTDLCVMKGRYPTEEDQRTLTSAGDSVDDQLTKGIGGSHPEAQFTIHMIREWKEQHAFVGEPSGTITVSAVSEGKPVELDITNEMKTACESLIEPVSEAIIDLLARVDPEYQGDVRSNIILSGCTSLIDGLDAALEATLGSYGGGKITRVKDPVFAGSDGGLALATEAEDADWEQLTD